MDEFLAYFRANEVKHRFIYLPEALVRPHALFAKCLSILETAVDSYSFGSLLADLAGFSKSRDNM